MANRPKCESQTLKNASSLLCAAFAYPAHNTGADYV